MSNGNKTVLKKGDTVHLYGEYTDKLASALGKIGITVVIDEEIGDGSAPDITVGVPGSSAYSAAMEAKEGIEKDSYFAARYAAYAKDGRFTIKTNIRSFRAESLPQRY